MPRIRHNAILAFAVAMFAEVLRASPHVASVGWSDVEAWVEDAVDGSIEAERELADLVRRARKLDAET